MPLRPTQMALGRRASGFVLVAQGLLIRPRGLDRASVYTAALVEGLSLLAAYLGCEQASTECGARCHLPSTYLLSIVW